MLRLIQGIVSSCLRVYSLEYAPKAPVITSAVVAKSRSFRTNTTSLKRDQVPWLPSGDGHAQQSQDRQPQHHNVLPGGSRLRPPLQAGDHGRRNKDVSQECFNPERRGRVGGQEGRWHADHLGQQCRQGFRRVFGEVTHPRVRETIYFILDVRFEKVHINGIVCGTAVHTVIGIAPNSSNPFVSKRCVLWVSVALSGVKVHYASSSTTSPPKA